MAQKSRDGATSMFTERGKAERLRRLRRVVEPIAPLAQRGSFEEEEASLVEIPAGEVVWREGSVTCDEMLEGGAIAQSLCAEGWIQGWDV
jgi:hypothetical protein